MNSKIRLLLLSSSRTPGMLPLEHARAFIREFLGSQVRRVLFVPYAMVMHSHAVLAERVAAEFEPLGYGFTSLHTCTDPAAAVEEAEALVVSGGNTFRLLHEIQKRGLLEPIRRRALAGMPYIGWSAGSNLACPSIRTTNDMPIVWPEQPDALGLLPFQINPHYTDIHPPGHQGETRDERLQEFMVQNPTMPVLGLREGSALLLQDGRLCLLGSHSAKLFSAGSSRELPPEESLQFLMDAVVKPA